MLIPASATVAAFHPKQTLRHAMTKTLALTLLLIVLAGCSAPDPSATPNTAATRELPVAPSFDIAPVDAGGLARAD